MQTASRIYLTGFMASGKSTLGPIVARKLGYTFMDLDMQIEAAAGMQISELFETRGDAAFRVLETEALKDTRNSEDVVIAVGGGALADNDNLDFALRCGLVVFLYATEDTLVRRLENEAATRPLLQDESGRPIAPPSVRRVIRNLMESRDRYYRQAQIILDVDRLSIDQAVRGLIDAISEYSCPDL